MSDDEDYEDSAENLLMDSKVRGSCDRMLAGSACSYTRSHSVVVKLKNREMCGTFSRRRGSSNKRIFDRIPPRLKFCLMDIVPTSYLDSHIFMGFSQCGQFLLSFTYNINMTTRRDFREGFNFRLHFLSWVPGQKAKLVHSVPLFDDDCVDSRVSVSMTQWKNNPSLLVVYGIAEISTENSYLSVIGVPRLGCSECIALSNSSDVLDCGGKKCLEHNFAIHTKFYAAESAICEPVVQLGYHNQIIIYTDFIHILEIGFIVPDQLLDEVNQEERIIQEQCIQNNSLPVLRNNQNVEVNQSTGSASANKVVQSILADFSDMEMEPIPVVKPVQVPDMLSHEVCIQALKIPQPVPGCSSVYVGVEDPWDSATSPRTLISPPLRSPRRRPAESLSRFSEMHRIADKTYEFVEETELKCEKLSIFRKRRLADKKYEFSEDNSENIVPFRVLRSNRKYYIGNGSRLPPKRAKSPPMEASILRVRNGINHPVVANDCNVNIKSDVRDMQSDVEYRVTAMLEDGSLKTIALHDNSSKTLSDCVVHPQDPYLVHSENSKCSKHFTRRFIESDDDITSIITDSEDDCISGYHVALPLVAHGACYAPLQPVSLSAWERLRPPAPVLQASQKSLDIELLCNEVCLRICRLYDKKFVYCFDWGCHVINVCQTSGCICGVCAMWLWATEVNSETTDDEAPAMCHNCKDSSSLCMVHRRQYSAECLFVWDLTSGLYRTEHASFKQDDTQDAYRESGGERARKIAQSLHPQSQENILTPSFNQDNRLLTTLTGKSLKRLTDMDHCIEITKQHPDSSESESEASVESDSD